MTDFFAGAGVVTLYIIIMASVFLGVRIFIKVPDELFRKILHFILLGAYIPLIGAFEKWWMASLYAVIMIVLLFPILSAVEKIPAFSAFMTQRKNGEIKNSMILALSVMAVSTFVCWGIFGDRYLVLACIYAWGVGDAFAALVGTRFGKHKIKMRFADKNKSVEGTMAMFISSAASVLLVLLFRGGLGVLPCLVISFAASAASAFTELCSKNGYDTFTCPAAAMIVILPLLSVMGG